MASSARTQKIRRASAPSLTASLTAGSSVAAMTYHAPVEVGVLEAAPVPGDLAAPASPSIAGVTSGETRTTSAPAASSAGTRRWATWPPPTTSDPAPGEAQAGGVRRVLVHGTIIASHGYRARDAHQCAD